MLKKLLKSCLAIAAVCAMSSVAFAEANVGANANATFSMYDGAADSQFDGQIMGNISGDKVSGMTWIDVSSERGLGPFFANVGWKVTDTVGIKVGSEIVPGSTGYVGDGGKHPGSGNISYFGSHAFIADFVFLAEGLHASIGLGSMNVYAGIIEDSESMTPYAYLGGKFGSIDLTAGVKMNAGDGVDMGMLVAFRMALGDSMKIAVDYHSQGDATCPAASIIMNELGPGNLGVALSMPSNSDDTTTLINYDVPLEPGAALDIFVNSAAKSDFGIGLSKAF
jgi:hypothetical protein